MTFVDKALEMENQKKAKKEKDDRRRQILKERRDIIEYAAPQDDWEGILLDLRKQREGLLSKVHEERRKCMAYNWLYIVSNFWPVMERPYRDYENISYGCIYMNYGYG